MRKFSFELQDVLDYRMFEQEQAESELGKALSAENSIKEELDDIARRYASSKKMISGDSDFSDSFTQWRFCGLLDSRKEDCLKRLAAAKLETERKRSALQEIMKKTAALNRLREQQQDEYRAAAEFEEDEAADDISSSRYKAPRG